MNKMLQDKLSLIPKKPGCYIWKNVSNEVIYVGKAKNLYNRVHQYFVFENNNPKKISLVNEIADIEYIVVNNENESLILENNLIKKYLPKYNILLKDQSEYPYIVISNETHPRIIYTHKINKIDGKYYGPLADTNFKKFKLYKLLNEIVPFRKCNKIPKEKCLYYDIGQCVAPCIKKIDQSFYKEWKTYINHFFKNKDSKILNIIKQKEMNAAELLNFEEAQKYKEMYDGLKSLQLSQIIELVNNDNHDYIAYYTYDQWISINIFIYKNDKLLNKTNKIFFVFDDYNDVLIEFLNNYYDLNSIPKNVIINLSRDNLDLLNAKFNNVFKAPNKTQLNVIQLALKNAKLYLEQQLLSSEYKQNMINSSLEQLKQITGLNNLTQIDVFDNSNLNLTNAVSGMVVYINGVLNKKLSRHYKLNTAENKSDYEFMKEVIYRRYSSHPIDTNLIIVDGGKIQVNAAIESLQKLNLNICVIGLKKDNKHKTNSIVLSNNTEIQLDKKSMLYTFLYRMQEEVHNFAITFFRNQKINNDLKSLLESIPGLGDQRIKHLFSIYKDINEINNASEEELSQILPKNVVKNLKKALNN